MKKINVEIRLYTYDELCENSKTKAITERDIFLKSLEIELSKDDVIKNIKNSNGLYFENGILAASEDYFDINKESFKLFFIGESFIIE